METTTLNPDWIEFLESLNAHGVEYLIIGAWAMAHHGRPRYTGDLDVLVEPSAENATQLMAALKQFGVPLTGISETDIQTVGTTISFGTPPRRIDLLNWLSGLTWSDAASDAEAGEMGSVPVRFLSLRAFRISSASSSPRYRRCVLKGCDRSRAFSPRGGLSPYPGLRPGLYWSGPSGLPEIASSPPGRC